MNTANLAISEPQKTMHKKITSAACFERSAVVGP
jgi:hypothetical protein